MFYLVFLIATAALTVDYGQLYGSVDNDKASFGPQPKTPDMLPREYA
jgi:hypothetical protein